MKKVILYQGLPGSGKSTYAKQLQNESPGSYKRVNKDDLRKMLDDGRYSKTNENFVKTLRNYIIIEALREGKSVLVDDTHLPLEPHYSQIKQAIREAGFDCPVEVDDSFLSVPYSQCVKQDLERPNSVGEAVIKKIYNRHLKQEVPPPEYNPYLPDAIIIDIDGTVAKMNGRSPYEYEKCDTDLPNQPVSDLVTSLLENCPDYDDTIFIFLSGREDSVYNKTLSWLRENVAEPSKLYMRATGDNRKDWEVKKEIYEQNIKSRFNMRFVLDDRRQVVDMWRSLGLTVLQVAEGEF